jgi:hypothetical protein
VEASNTPTIRRLTLSRRHQLSLIARLRVEYDTKAEPVPPRLAVLVKQL